MNFVHVPKTGGTSIADALGIDTIHRRASETPAPRFGFVRHPLDRLVSTYCYMHDSAPAPSMRLATGRTLREFLEVDHFLLHPQTYWLDAPMDFVGRFERLRDDFAKVSDKPLPHVGATDHGPWRDYFDEETLAAAVSRYRTDFAAFDYPVP